MARTEKNTETMNQAVANKWLWGRFNRILENDRLDEVTVDAMIAALTEWKGTFRERAIAKLDAEIARLQEMRELAIKDMSESA